MKNILKNLVFAAGAALLLTACMEDRDLSYQGPDQLEFKNPRAGFGVQPANNVANTVSARTVRQGVGRDSILVQLIGAQKSQPIDINYEIDATTTAVEGTNFNIIGTKGKATIPANSSAGYIYVQFLPGIPTTAPTTQTVRLVLKLNNSGEIQPAEKYRLFTYTVRN
jgi:hypothetical protein